MTRSIANCCPECGCAGVHGCLGPNLRWLGKLAAHVARLEDELQVPSADRYPPLPPPDEAALAAERGRPRDRGEREKLREDIRRLVGWAKDLEARLGACA